MIIYILNCYEKLINKLYKRDFYVGKVKSYRNLKYRLRTHYKGHMINYKQYNFIDLGHLYKPNKNEELYIEKAFINTSVCLLIDIIKEIGLYTKYKIQIDGHDCSEYLYFQDKGYIDYIDINKQFWNDKPNMIHIVGDIINIQKNERGKIINIKCSKCGYKSKEIFDYNNIDCPICGYDCTWNYDWACMVN